jgi:hypothetical protein
MTVPVANLPSAEIGFPKAAAEALRPVATSGTAAWDLSKFGVGPLLEC